MRVVVIVILLLARQWLFAQCSLPPQLTIPVADKSLSNAYAAVSDSFGDYMVVAEYDNDSLDFDAGIVHLYRLTAGDTWTRIAILAPSDPQEFMHFGFFLSITESTIAIVGNRYDSDGHNRERIYVFEQDGNGEWTSGTESYKIEISTATDYYIHAIDLSSGYLAVGFEENFKNAKVGIYRHDPGQFTFVQNIDGPLDVDGSNRYFAERISLTDDLLAVTSASHKNVPNSFYDYGRTFLYERTGALWNSLPVASLQPSDRNAFINIQFGRDVQIDGTTVFVAAHQNVANANSKNTVYVYTRPSSGWGGDLVESSQIQNGENGFQYWDMVTDGDYLFLPNIDWTAVAIHKRTGATWNDHSLVQTIALPAWAGDNWGRSMTLTGSHFVAGMGAGAETTSSDGKMVDYKPSSQWETGYVLHQQFGETSINATMDGYGDDIAVSQQWMAAGADGDDDKGEYSGAVYLYETSPSGWIQKQKISAHDGKPFMYFGRAVALSADQLFVGAIARHSYNSDGSIFLRETGAVYVYKRIGATWQFDEMIEPPNLKLGARFGQEVSYANGYIAVSEFTENGTGSMGLVHVYKENASGDWVRIATLTPSDHIETETFGRSIAMNDSTIVIGTGGVQTHIAHFMKAYVFKKDGEWHNATEHARLFPENQLYGDWFGYSVALHGDQVIVGAPGYSSENHLPEDGFKGTAYVFLKPSGGWSGDIHEVARLSPSNPSRHGAFGTSVAIDDDDIYVGSPHSYFVWNVVDNLNNDDGQLKPGTVYHYYKKSGWTTTAQEDEQIPSIQGEVRDMFGSGLVLQDGFLFIGALFDDTSAGHSSGSVLSFPQMPLITGVATPCVEDGLVSLYAIPWGGMWSISGYPPQTATTIELPAGSYTASYTVGGCISNTFAFDVISSGRVISDTSPDEIEKCFYNNASVYLRSNALLQDYSWFYKRSESDNYTLFEDGTDEITTKEEGYYLAEVNHPVCNKITKYFHVRNESIATVTIEKPPIVCAEEVVQLKAFPAGGVWSSPASAAGEINPAALPDGEYLVGYTFTTPLGCLFSKQETVVINKHVKPLVSKSGDHLCVDSPVTLTVVNMPVGAHVDWYTVDRPDNSISTAQAVGVTEPGNYFATVSNHSCALSSDPVLLETMPDTLFVPNVITPNGDTKNDFFEIISEGIADIQMVLFNRYGSRVFTTHDTSFKWDAGNVNSGVYYWHMQYTTCGNRRREFKGTVHVLHD
jgi:gliding motility-associated-like protein